jgi:hypothetical protein
VLHDIGPQHPNHEIAQLDEAMLAQFLLPQLVGGVLHPSVRLQNDALVRPEHVHPVGIDRDCQVVRPDEVFTRRGVGCHHAVASVVTGQVHDGAAATLPPRRDRIPAQILVPAGRKPPPSPRRGGPLGTPALKTWHSAS